MRVLEAGFSQVCEKNQRFICQGSSKAVDANKNLDLSSQKVFLFCLALCRYDVYIEIGLNNQYKRKSHAGKSPKSSSFMVYRPRPNLKTLSFIELLAPNWPSRARFTRTGWGPFAAVEAESEDAELLTVLVRYGFCWLICLGPKKRKDGWVCVCGWCLVDFCLWMFGLPTLEVGPCELFSFQSFGFHLIRCVRLVGVYSYHTGWKFHKLKLECSTSLFLLNVTVIYILGFQDKLQGSVLRSHNHRQGLAMAHGPARHTKIKKGCPDFVVPKRFGYLIWIPALKQIHPWDLNNLNMSKFCLSAAFDLGFARKNYGISSSNCDWLANIPMLGCFFTWLPITNYSHIVDTSHKTRGFLGFQFSPFATGISFSLLPSNMSFGPSRMPAENSKGFLPRRCLSQKGLWFQFCFIFFPTWGRLSNFQPNFSNGWQRTQHRETVDCEASSQLSAFEKNWSTWGIFFSESKQISDAS